LNPIIILVAGNIFTQYNHFLFPSGRLTGLFGVTKILKDFTSTEIFLKIRPTIDLVK